MAGFPTRISRSSLGPPLIDTRPVRDPSREVGQAPLNLAWWTVAGVAATAPVAWALATFTGPSTITLTAHGEAWTGGAAPVVARTSVGVYTYTFATSYADETGDLVFPGVLAAMVTPQSLTDFRAIAIVVANVVTVSINNAAGLPADSSFMLSVW